MRIEVETTGGLGRRLTVQVPSERVDAEVEKRLKRMGQRAKIKGFRPGKVPLKVLHQHYGDEVRREVLGDVMQTTYTEALDKESLHPAAAPHIETVETSSGKDLEYTATFEVYPKVELKGLDGLALERPVAEVGEDDVDRMVDSLRRQRADWEPVDRPAQEGDTVRLGFKGTKDGQPVPGTEAESELVELGAGRMIPDFEAALLGVSKGEEKTFPATFPEGYAVADLAGQTIEFTVNVHSVDEIRIPELDDELLKTFGIDDGDADKLRAEVRESMERERDASVRRILKDRALEAVLAANPIELPAVLVDQEVESLQSEAMSRSGQDPKSLEGRPERELFEPAARRRVSLGLIVGEVISSQNLVLDRDKLEERLRAMVEEHPDPEAAARQVRSDRGFMQRLELMVMEDQVVDLLLERATLRDEQVSFKDLMDF